MIVARFARRLLSAIDRVTLVRARAEERGLVLTLRRPSVPLPPAPGRRRLGASVREMKRLRRDLAELRRAAEGLDRVLSAQRAQRRKDLT